MAQSLQHFMATAVQRAADDLVVAVERLPDDKKGWSPMGGARTALNQAAEVALLNGSTAYVIENRKFPDDFDFPGYERERDDLAKDWNAIKALLNTNTAKVAAAILTVPDDDLSTSVDMPWGAMTLAQILSYPFWNACYHEGQVNYIASMLELL